MVRTTPISHIAAVFVPVKELGRAAAWWSRLLDLPLPDSIPGGVYSLPVGGGTGLILDPNQYGFPHLVMYGTDDIDGAYRFAKERRYDIFHDMQRFSNVAYFNVFDDGKNNGIMVCQGDHETKPARQSGHCPIRPEIGRVFAHSGDVGASASWYGEMLGIPPEHGCELQPRQGAKLHILDRRRNPIPAVRYDKLNAEIVSHPMFELTTADLAAARRWAEAHGAAIVEPDNGEGSGSFHFRDPDGNTNRIAERPL
ncbi:VOC family protein [Paenibacillus sp. GYB003]|uniref:VOC family protein n=1 Tax=Paenibacillus sp. GYB003 TaxID=2994392 RepID=UPI002F9684CA